MTNPRDIIERVLNEHVWLHDRINLAACLCGQWQRPYHDDEARKLWEAHRAKAVETALAEAGLLRRPEACPYDHSLDPGPDKTRLTVPLTTETRVEWTTTATLDVGGGTTDDEAKAQDWLRRDREWPTTHDSDLVVRRVHTEPWQASR
jgi:hypothetical protein